jgi:hypothetical protein
MFITSPRRKFVVLSYNIEKFLGFGKGESVFLWKKLLLKDKQPKNGLWESFLMGFATSLSPLIPSLDDPDT